MPDGHLCCVRKKLVYKKAFAVSCLVNWTRNLVTLYAHAWGGGMNGWTPKTCHLPAVYPNLLSELGNDSGFCNEIAFTFPPRIMAIIRESLTNFSHPLQVVVVVVVV